MDWQTVKEQDIFKEEYVRDVESGKETWNPKPYNKQSVTNQIKSYLEFAWDKANNMRGLSAARSMMHFSNWFYMFGNEDTDILVRELLEYEYYGKPWLAIISELFDIDWSSLDDGCWANNSEEECIDDIREVIKHYKSRIPFDSIKRFLNSES